MNIPQRLVNRATPLMPTQSYRTFAVRSPLSTHFRRATCAEVDCTDYRNGWFLLLDGLPADLLYAATHSGKRYREGEHLGQRALLFEAGQPCFRESTHVTSLQRPEFYFAGRGDHRSFSTRRAHQYDKPTQFVDDFSTHLDRIKREIERG